MYFDTKIYFCVFLGNQKKREIQNFVYFMTNFVLTLEIVTEEKNGFKKLKISGLLTFEVMFLSEIKNGAKFKTSVLFMFCIFPWNSKISRFILAFYGLKEALTHANVTMKRCFWNKN